MLLTGGNPQIAKADGDAPVREYIAAMPGWKRDLGKRLDALIVRNVPNVRKAVKWNTPFYGIEGQGWFLGFHTFTHYVKVAFFRGRSLRPVPPGASKGKSGKWEASVTVTIRDAAAVSVTGATVTGSWSGASNGSVSGATASNGSLTLGTGPIAGGTSVTFTVTNVAGSGLTYNQAANTDPDGDSTGTAITVAKP